MAAQDIKSGEEVFVIHRDAILSSGPAMMTKHAVLLNQDVLVQAWGQLLFDEIMLVLRIMGDRIAANIEEFSDA